MIAATIRAFVTAERLSLLPTGINAVQGLSGSLFVWKTPLSLTSVFFRTKEECEQAHVGSLAYRPVARTEGAGLAVDFEHSHRLIEHRWF
jgi:hypothetical protein